MIRYRNFVLSFCSCWVLAACLSSVDTEELAPVPPPSIEVSVINAGTVNEEDILPILVFELQISAISTNDIIINYETRGDTAASGADFVAQSGVATIVAGQLSTSVSIEIIDDSIDEPEETLFLDISSVSEGVVIAASASGTIVDADAAPTILVSGGSVVEGNAGQTEILFPLSLRGPSGFAVVVDYSTADQTATAGSDYLAVTGQVSIPAGTTNAAISVGIIGDAIDENDETFVVSLDAVSNAVVGVASATGTIVDDDDASPPMIIASIAEAVAVSEDAAGSSLVFPVTISMTSSVDIVVEFQTVAGSATLGVDFVMQSSSVVIPAGQVNGEIVIDVIDDFLDEPTESMTVSLTSVSIGSIGAGSATGSILDDDLPPTISVLDTSVAEGDTGQATLVFLLELNAPSGFDISVDYETTDASAIAGSDYSRTSGTAVITAGDVSTLVSVPVLSDSTLEPDESLSLVISMPTNVVVSDGSAVGTIVNDDSEPTISIDDAVLVEGDTGQSNMVFQVALSSSSSVDVTFDYSTSDSTATGGDDYTAVSSSGLISSGSLTTTINVAVIGDTVVEPDETFDLSLSGVVNATVNDGSAIGTITNDDTTPTISIADASIVEGDSGQSDLEFTVSLSAPTGADVTFNYATNDISATAGDDYVVATASGTIVSGTISSLVVVQVIGDSAEEGDETLGVSISGVANATVADDTAIGTIVDDDSEPTISIDDAVLVEGDIGQSNMVFQVALSSSSSVDVTFDYSTSDSTATGGDDYTAVSSSGLISSGSLTTTINVAVIGDTVVEPDETFDLSLSGVVNATVNDGSAIGTITNDDTTPTISIADASIVEGDSGQSDLEFTVSLSAPTGADVTFNYATNDISATAGDDYVAATASGTIVSGTISSLVVVQVIGDSAEEGDETLGVSISGVANAIVADDAATGTIVDDDASFQSGLENRPSNLTCIAPDQPIVNTSIATQVAFPNLPSLVQPVALLHPPGDFSQWFVVEQAGRILRFDNSSSTSTVSDFIDIRSSSDPIDVKSDHSETGLLGMAFHPDYGSGNWFVYLNYMIDGGSAGADYFSVVSRFESKDNGITLDATDSVELLRIDQPFTNHNGGHLEFGPDGYLYIALGDGGAGGDPGDRSQNMSNLFGNVLRIDVDGGSPYGIPVDNPFAGNAFCNDGEGIAACPEIFASGLRNPWKFSFDDATGQLWLGDVGQDAVEEINLVELGGNYGWRCKEGSQIFDPSGNCPAGLIDPVIEYSHSVGNSVTGGLVYRGTLIPELSGRYVFADYAQGKIFASTSDGIGGYDYEQLLDTPHFISAFANEQNGELLYLNYGAGEIRRIIQSGGNAGDLIPDLLSATGCVNVLNPRLPADGLVPYDLNVPFWSDGASKERWYAIPDGTTIDVLADGDWQFPIGTVLVKNFSLSNTLIETRLFMRHTNGEWGGYTYEWNAAGTDADRIVGGKQVMKVGQDWIYPSGAECLQCHTQAAGFSLGVEHGQLNKDLTYPSTGQTGNQLFTADFVGLLTDPLSDDPANLPKFADPSNTGESLDARARAYLHSNCAGCHRAGGPTPSDMDLRHAIPLQNTNTCGVTPTSGDLGIPGARLIDPGSPATSLLIERTARRDSHGMPPLGSLFSSAGRALAWHARGRRFDPA